MKYLVGIDEGTTGCKVAVYDHDGNLASISAREYPSYYPREGWVEQNIFEIQKNVFDACREAIEKSKVNSNDIVACSHSNQGITLVLLDEHGAVVRDRTIGWQDVRHTEMLPSILEKISDSDHYKIAGMGVAAYNTAILNWLQKYEPETWAKVARCCSHQDYFLHQYGADGYFTDEGCANFLSMCDVETAEWDDRLMALYGMDRSRLPIISHKPGQVVGTVSKKVSELTGLPSGCKICVGGLDTNCSALGAGVVNDGDNLLIVGTAGVSILVSDKFVSDPDGRVTVRGNPGLNNWQLYIMTNTAASAFRWFRDALCSLEVSVSHLMGEDPYNIMTQIAVNSKPGANGVTALACLQGSHGRRKNEKARGTILGISLGTSKADIAQAILEGITFEIRDLLDMQSKMAEIKKIRLCGGAAKSSAWCQMFADILHTKVETTVNPELGGLGAAMCAGIGAGVFRDINDAIGKCVKIDKSYLPDEKNIEAYDNAYSRWNNAYETLNKFY
ncbi:MAG: carbohydrate kinase [Candidatus Adiutrix sp.]|jgi:xylulokinase|nr:carbohydrate kinase [Candidatus Adiutrix sp.]